MTRTFRLVSVSVLAALVGFIALTSGGPTTRVSAADNVVVSASINPIVTCGGQSTITASNVTVGAGVVFTLSGAGTLSSATGIANASGQATTIFTAPTSAGSTVIT